MTERTENGLTSALTSPSPTSRSTPPAAQPPLVAAPPAVTVAGGLPGGGEDFAALFAAAERTGKRGRPIRYAVGDRVSGKVVSIGRDVAIIDLEAGGEGTLDAVELRDQTGQLTAKVGDTVEARVVAKGEKEGVVTLRRAAARGMEARASLGQFASSGLPVEGTVTGVNKGGLEVNVAGLRAFCPVSQIEMRQVTDMSVYVGQKMLFRITKYDEEDARGPNVVLSRRALLEEERRTRAAETRVKLVVGAVISGVVTSIKDFGAFVDLGGVDGLLPASELGFQRGSRPADVLSVGQTVTVQILRMERREPAKREATRRDGGRGDLGKPRAPGPLEQITLSLKSLQQDPWDDAVAQLPVGTTIKGNVTRAEAFGAFVEVIPGVEGLLHVSELGAGKMLRHARDAAKPGDSLDVTVLSIDREKRRISLALASEGDRVDDEGRAAASRAGGSSGMGTFGDLLQGKLR